MSVRGHVVGCGVQGGDCLALDLSSAKDGRLTVNWALAGALGNLDFAKTLSKKVGGRHFWVSPSEAGGLQLEAAKAVELPKHGGTDKATVAGYYSTQVKSGFVSDDVVVGGLKMLDPQSKPKKPEFHHVGGGALVGNVKQDYLSWYSLMKIRRPHVASSALALANTYLALYPEERRREKPLRMIVLNGRSLHRAILMDDWKYVDEVMQSRMNDELDTQAAVDGRAAGWINHFKALHPEVFFVKKDRSEPPEERSAEPLIVRRYPEETSVYELWDVWAANGRMTELKPEIDEAVRVNCDISPVAFGMALQGGC